MKQFNNLSINELINAQLNITFGSWESGIHFIVNVKTRMAQKLRRIILLHLGLLTFRSHFPRIHKIIIFVIFGLGRCVHGIHNQSFLTLEKPRWSNKYRDTVISFQKIVRRPVFRGAPRLRDQDSLSFQQLAVIAIQLSGISFYVFRGPKYPGICVPRSRS